MLKETAGFADEVIKLERHTLKLCSDPLVSVRL
jgi:hypothetical protein